MSQTSRLGTSLGFPLGGVVKVLATALSVTMAAGACTPTLHLHLSAAGLTTASGSVPTVESFRGSRLNAQLGFCLGDNIDLKFARPNSVRGLTQAQGRAVASLVVNAAGATRCSAAINLAVSATAAGQTVAAGSIVSSVREQGAASVATTRGQVPAVSLSVTALGVVATDGAAGATISAHATAVGRTTASGSVDKQTLGVSALGVVTTIGSCSIPMPASQITCVSGSGGPITPTPANAVY